MFDLRRLRLLHELSMRGTLSAVADALSFSPSTISQQLAQLEREAGVPLLEPDGRRVRLTAQGEALAAHAARMLAADEAARAELEMLQPSLAPVRLAVMQSAAHGLVPRALDVLAETEPRLRVEIAELAPEEGLFEVAARGFDLAVAEQYPGHTREQRALLERRTLGRDAIRLAVAHDDPATSLADLTAHVRLVASGHAVGMIPALVFGGDEPATRSIDLPERPRREIFTAVRRGTADRPGIRAVRAALEEAFARVPEISAGRGPTG